MATGTRTAVSGRVTKNQRKLDDILRDVCGLRHDPRDEMNAGIVTHNISKALTREGIVSPVDLFALDPTDIDSLQYEESGSLHSPLISTRRLLKQLIHYFHALSRDNGKAIDVTRFTKARFDEFRTSDYDASAPLSPWNTKVNKDMDTEIANWMWNIKPNAKAYKDFKEEAYWLRAKEQIIGTLEAQGLL